MERQFLSQLIGEEEIMSIQPGKFNVLKANAGAGKTTLLLEDKIIKNFARNRSNVVYLIHNLNTQEFIATRHMTCAKAFDQVDTDNWLLHRKGVKTFEEPNDDYVHIMCYQTFAALIRNEGTQWLDDIDLIIWDEFDDIRSFYKTETNSLQKLLPTANNQLLHSILSDYNPQSLSSFIKIMKEEILEPGRIVLLAASASPEVAAALFQDYLNTITFGEAQIQFAAKERIWYKDLQQAFKDGTIHPAPGRVYWCFTTFIWEEHNVERGAKGVNFDPIVMWSVNNQAHRHEWSSDHDNWDDCLKHNKPLPMNHDFIIVNGAYARGIDITDTRITDWIFAGESYEELVQFMRARFDPEREYLPIKMKGMVQFIQDGIPANYYKWHTLEELKELLIDEPIFKDWREEELNNTKWEGKPFTTWESVKKYYGDKIEHRRFGRNRITQYRFKPTHD